MIQVFNTISDWQNMRQSLHEQSLGFVPTMGALHQGHTSLIKRSLDENHKTLVSLFVNPTQFNNKSDLESYPSQHKDDIELLSSLGVHYALHPPYEDLYPDDYRYKVNEAKLSTRFCGRHRPGHFDGVLTVVMKLLNIARASKVYFGEKDYQQYLLIRDMVKAFFINTEVIACPIIRERDQLAMSSRNVLLNSEDREKAPKFYQILKNSKSAEDAYRKLESSGFKPDYVEDFESRRLGAVHLGDVRLIDNAKL